MPDSVLDAIKMGVWDFEPSHDEPRSFSATEALPGSEEKLYVLSERVRQGLPLWHPSDRRDWEDLQAEA